MNPAEDVILIRGVATTVLPEFREYFILRHEIDGGTLWEIPNNLWLCDWCKSSIEVDPDKLEKIKNILRITS